MVTPLPIQDAQPEQPFRAVHGSLQVIAEERRARELVVGSRIRTVSEWRPYREPALFAS